MKRSLLVITILFAFLCRTNAQVADKKGLTLDGARSVIAAAIAEAKKLNAPGGVIAVVDDGGSYLPFRGVSNCCTRCGEVRMVKGIENVGAEQQLLALRDVKAFMPWAIGGFAINLITGVLFLIMQPHLYLSSGVWWRIHMWLGAPFLAGVVGLSLSYLIAPPHGRGYAAPQGRASRQPRPAQPRQAVPAGHHRRIRRALDHPALARRAAGPARPSGTPA